MYKYLKNLFHSIVIRISLALYETETEILKSHVLDSKGGKIHQRKRFRNKFIEMMLSGVKDDEIVTKHYQILRGAEKYMKEATPHKIAVSADKHGMNYSKADKFGRYYEHLGFFDDKHKYAGKTIKEVLVLEYEERKTKDDDYELLDIYDNSPVEVGLADIMLTVEKIDKETADFEYQANDLIQHSKKFKFPIRCSRDDDKILNKIEHLSESLHVKKIGFNYVQLEFFIPLKFGTDKIDDDSNIFKDLTNIKQIYINDDYGERIGFTVNNFKKRIIYKDYDVWKFEGEKMQTIKI